MPPTRIRAPCHKTTLIISQVLQNNGEFGRYSADRPPWCSGNALLERVEVFRLGRSFHPEARSCTLCGAVDMPCQVQNCKPCSLPLRLAILGSYRPWACRHNCWHNEVLFEKEHKMASESNGRCPNEAVIYKPAIEGPSIAHLVDLE